MGSCLWGGYRNDHRFWVGGWSTAATTKKISEEAILESQAAICVGQFMNQSNHEEKLKEIGEVSNYQKADFIEKGGWDIMPGQEKADYGVSRSCADGIGLLIKQ